MKHVEDLLALTPNKITRIAGIRPVKDMGEIGRALCQLGITFSICPMSGDGSAVQSARWRLFELLTLRPEIRGAFAACCAGAISFEGVLTQIDLSDAEQITAL